MNRILASVVLASGLWLHGLAAVDYYVSVDGSDEGNDGLSADTAFATLQRGLDALATGDTLWVLPGEYFGTAYREGLGGMEAETRISAVIPGTVLLRGDVAAPQFRPLDGYRYIYVADFDQPVQAVNERDTLSILESVPSLGDLELVPGCFYYDPAVGKLYISTSDMMPAESHLYTVSVLGKHGLYLEQPKRVVIEGLAATGFNSAGMQDAYPGYRAAWGIIIGRGTECVIRDCIAFLNGGGIGLFTARPKDSGRNNLIERCGAWGNGSRFSQEGGNILGFSVNDDIIRECYAYSGKRHGIRLYGGIATGLLKNCIAWGNVGGTEGWFGDLFIKGGTLGERGRAENCVAVGSGHVMNLHNSLVGGYNSYHRDLVTPPDNIRLSQETDIDPNREFADPHNLDYRLQADSRFRGAGPDGSDRGPFPYEPVVVFISPSGDDAADGLSLSRARQSLPRTTDDVDGLDTLYLSPDTHKGDLIIERRDGDSPLYIRGRGEGMASIDGSIRVEHSSSVVFERIRFFGTVVASESSAVTFKDCEFANGGDSLAAWDVDGLRIEHCRLSNGGVVLDGCRAVYLAGNAFAGQSGPAVVVDDVAALLYSDYNGYAASKTAWQVAGELKSLEAIQPEFDRHSLEIADGFVLLTAGPLGKPIGNTKRAQLRQLQVSGPYIHATSDTTVDIEWWTSAMTTCDLSWAGPDGEVHSREFQANGFTSFSITGLAPGTEYTFNIGFREPFELIDGHRAGDAAVISFRTANAPQPPFTWYVATDGDDSADGRSSQTALRTICAAAAKARVGDTVIVGGGTYSETVWVRSTGTAGRPVTFRSAPGEKVILDGAGRTIAHAFIATAKDAIHIDGFYFVGIGGDYPGEPSEVGLSGAVLLYEVSDALISRCFMDGRGTGYSPGIVGAWLCPDLRIENCVVTACFVGMQIANCPGLQIRNSVFLRNMIQAMTVVNAPQQPFIFEGNVITDSGSNKVKVCLLELASTESFVERNNCYVLRIDDAERKPFMFYDEVAYDRAARYFGLPQGSSDRRFPELSRQSVAEFQELVGPTGSVVAKGVFAVERGFEPNPDLFGPDRVIGVGTLDFPDLFTADPNLAERGIGLRPEAFSDFHFASGQR